MIGSRRQPVSADLSDQNAQAGADSKEMVFRENMVIVIQPNLHDLRRKNGPAVRRDTGGEENGCESLNAYPRQWVICQG
jgi:hypothetical protein